MEITLDIIIETARTNVLPTVCSYNSKQSSSIAGNTFLESGAFGEAALDELNVV
jgi:hypothetical protein